VKPRRKKEEKKKYLRSLPLKRGRKKREKLFAIQVYKLGRGE